MTNSLALGCDCKGSIHYLDAAFVRKFVCRIVEAPWPAADRRHRNGEPYAVKNAVCIHEEDDGILFKHTDFRMSATPIIKNYT